MAQTHLADVLKATGLPEDQVKALSELPDDTKDFKTDAYVAPIRTNVETQVKNDPKFYEGLNRDNLPKEFLKTLESEQYGRSAAQVRANMLKAVGLTDKDFTELGDEGKKIDVFTPAFVKKLSEGKVGDKELQAKLIEANTKISEMETAIPTLEAKFKTEYEGKINDFQFASQVATELASVKGLRAPAKYLVGDISTQLKSKYAIVVTNGVAEVKQKDKPTLDVLTDNGKKILSLSGAIQLILDSDDLVDKKQTTTTTTTTQVNTTNGELKITKNVNDKISKRLKEDQNAG